MFIIISQKILELGTSLGITTSYLAFANPAAKIITMEGAPEIASHSKKNFNQLNLSNIKIVEGNFDKHFSSVINQLSTVDFAFIDGNHRKATNLKLFQSATIKSNSIKHFYF